MSTSEVLIEFYPEIDLLMWMDFGFWWSSWLQNRKRSSLDVVSTWSLPAIGVACMMCCSMLCLVNKTRKKSLMWQAIPSATLCMSEVQYLHVNSRVDDSQLSLGLVLAWCLFGVTNHNEKSPHHARRPTACEATYVKRDMNRDSHPRLLKISKCEFRRRCDFSRDVFVTCTIWNCIYPSNSNSRYCTTAFFRLVICLQLRFCTSSFSLGEVLWKFVAATYVSWLLIKRSANMSHEEWNL